MANDFSSEPIDSICGGRHQILLHSCTQLLDALKATDCTLVFFSDLNIQDSKIEEWLTRRNNEFDFYVNLYDSIITGKDLKSILAEQKGRGDNRSITSAFYGMGLIAKKYGDFFFSTKHEADLEVAQYAKHQNAMTVVSDDTDFLIFEGSWRLWSTQNIKITPSNKTQLKTTEYNRYYLANTLSLSTHQLPLFATLLGNDFTKPYFSELGNLYKHLGAFRYRFQNVARYIRNMNHGIDSRYISDNNIRKIVHLICGCANYKMEQLIKNSIESYNTDFVPAVSNDSIEAKLLHTNMYRPYMFNAGPLNGITLPFYDLRGCASGETNLPQLLTDWIERRKGIAKQTSCEFTLLVRRNFHESCRAYTKFSMQPDCEYAVMQLNEIN